MFKDYLSQYSTIPISSWRKILASLINSLGEGITFFLSLFFFNNLHMPIEKVGYLMSLYGLGTVMGGIVGGKLSDRFTPEAVSITSLFIRILSFIFLIKVQSTQFLYINLFFLGMASYSFLTSNKQEALRYCQNATQKIRVISTLYACSNLGIGISALVIGWVSKFGFNLSFSFSALLFLLCAVYLFFIDIKFKNKIQSKRDLNPCENEFKKEISHKSKRNYPLYVSAFCLFLLGLVVSLRCSVYSIYIKTVLPHLGLHWIGLLFMLNPLIIMIFQTPIVNKFSKYNKFSVMGIGIFLYGLGSFILSFASIFEFAILSCVVLTIGEMLSFSTIQYVFYECSEENQKGFSLGLYQSTYGASAVVGPTIGGLLFKFQGGEFVWFASGAIGCICLAICLASVKLIKF